MPLARKCWYCCRKSVRASRREKPATACFNRIAGRVVCAGHGVGFGGEHPHHPYHDAADCHLAVRDLQRRHRLDLLLKVAGPGDVLRDACRRGPWEPGIIAVLHNAGSRLNWNPHVHMIATDG
jgi:hypothetical protein